MGAELSLDEFANLARPYQVVADALRVQSNIVAQVAVLQAV